MLITKYNCIPNYAAVISVDNPEKCIKAILIPLKVVYAENGEVFYSLRHVSMLFKHGKIFNNVTCCLVFVYKSSVKSFVRAGVRMQDGVGMLDTMN